MEQVRIQISPKQKSKLRNGHKVRIKKPIEGEGLNLIVMPQNFSLITRAFTRNKGAEIVLSPEEILANKEQIPMEGEGIFGRKFDVGAERVLGKRGKKRAYQYAREVLNPIAKGAITAGLATAGTALGAVQPELIPFIAPGVPALSYMAYDYLDNPSAYQSNAGGPRTRESKQLGKQYLQQQALNQVNSQLGTNMGYMTQAGISQAVQDKATQALNAGSIQARKALLDRLNAGIENVSTLSAEEKALLKGTTYEYLVGGGLHPMGAGLGYGLSAGAGLGAGLYASNKRGGSIVGLNGGMVHTTPQALQSQPMATNFQFRYTLPVPFQSIIR